MADAIFIGGLVLAILCAVVMKARQALREDADTPQGLAPGTGDHIIEVEYSSGLGGGHATRIRVPRDPQAYARAFVPMRERPAAPRDKPSQAGSRTAGNGTGARAIAARDRKKDEQE
ncbi:MAG: hypothetical protein AAGG09_15640 [Pseudomonadota bacterium]